VNGVGQARHLCEGKWDEDHGSLEHGPLMSVSDRLEIGSPLDAGHEKRIRERIGKIPIFRTLGFRDFEITRGCCRCVLPWNRDHDGIFETFHGGLMQTAADSAAALAVLTVVGPDETIATTDMSIRFLSPLRSDLIVTARVLKAGRRLVPVEIQLHDMKQRLVATSQVGYTRLPAGP